MKEDSENRLIGDGGRGIIYKPVNVFNMTWVYQI